jgi:hypothetical protein
MDCQYLAVKMAANALAMGIKMSEGHNAQLRESDGKWSAVENLVLARNGR